MARSYTPTAMYRYGAMQNAGGAGERYTRLPTSLGTLSSTQVAASFVGTASVTDDATQRAKWSVSVDGTPATTASLADFPNVIIITISGDTIISTDVVLLSYDGTGDATIEGTPVGAFTDYLVTNNE